MKTLWPPTTKINDFVRFPKLIIGMPSAFGPDQKNIFMYCYGKYFATGNEMQQFSAARESPRNTFHEKLSKDLSAPGIAKTLIKHCISLTGREDAPGTFATHFATGNICYGNILLRGIFATGNEMLQFSAAGEFPRNTFHSIIP